MEGNQDIELSEPGTNASTASNADGEEDFERCVTCNNMLEMCVCVCTFCGERDRCECALFDAATGG